MKTSIAIVTLAALAAVGSFVALSPSYADHYGPQPSPQHILVDRVGYGGDTSELDADCGPGFWDVQMFGTEKVCTPASQAQPERYVDEHSGRWVLPQ